MIDRLLRGERPDLDALIAAFGDVLPELAELRSTLQDPGWHAEGDVHVHTQMVLDELYQALETDEAAALDATVRREVILGALLHDVAKPLTTKRLEIRGVERIGSPKHEAKGRSLVATALVDLLPWESVWRIMQMVGSHHEPKFLVVKDRSPGEYRRISRRVDPLRVIWLERADMRGRMCSDRAQQLEAVDLFQLGTDEYAPDGWYDRWRAHFAETLDGRPEVFRDRVFGEAIYAFEADRVQSPEDAAFLAHQAADPPELVLLCGPSGSGKSTFFERVLRPRGYEVVSLDEIREELAGDRSDQALNGAVRQAAKKRLQASLRPGRRVVWDATCLRKDFRSMVLQLGFDYGALVTLAVFQQSRADLYRRNQARPHPVPRRVLDDQLAHWEFPEVDEAHRMVVLDGEGGLRGAFGCCGDPPWGLR